MLACAEIVQPVDLLLVEAQICRTQVIFQLGHVFGANDGRSDQRVRKLPGQGYLGDRIASLLLTDLLHFV